jgi:hypothetical protein
MKYNTLIILFGRVVFFFFGGVVLEDSLNSIFPSSKWIDVVRLIKWSGGIPCADRLLCAPGVCIPTGSVLMLRAGPAGIADGELLDMIRC